MWKSGGSKMDLYFLWKTFLKLKTFLKIFFKIDRDLAQSLQRELKVLKNMFFLLFGTLGRYLVGSKNWGAIPNFSLSRIFLALASPRPAWAVDFLGVVGPQKGPYHLQKPSETMRKVLKSV